MDKIENEPNLNWLIVDRKYDLINFKQEKLFSQVASLTRIVVAIRKAI